MIKTEKSWAQTEGMLQLERALRHGSLFSPTITRITNSKRSRPICNQTLINLHQSTAKNEDHALESQGIRSIGGLDRSDRGGGRSRGCFVNGNRGKGEERG